jgi:hypothetical protein
MRRMKIIRPGPEVRVALAAGLVLGVGGCATDQGGVPGELSRAVAAAASAASSGELAVELLADERTTRTATDIALVNMLAESQDAEFAAITLVVETDQEARQREDVLDAIRDGTAALVAARVWASAGDADPARVDSVAGDLASSAETLDALADDLEAAS